MEIKLNFVLIVCYDFECKFESTNSIVLVMYYATTLHNGSEGCKLGLSCSKLC